MKVATYNLNGIRARLPRLVEWLEREKPDVACLQELKCADESLPIADIEAQGYGAVWHGQRAFHGVAILSHGETPVETRRGLPGDPTDVQARYVEARTKGIVIASVYLPNGNPVPSPNFDYKLRWFDRFVAHAEQLYARSEPVLLAGDLNVVPTDFDIYNAYWWRSDAVMQPQPRAAFERLLSMGWTDTVRSTHPNERMYSYWVNEGAYRRKQGFRLDFILANEAASSRLRGTGVDAEYRVRERPSDHAPVWMQLATE